MEPKFRNKKESAYKTIYMKGGMLSKLLNAIFKPLKWFYQYLNMLLKLPAGWLFYNSLDSQSSSIARTISDENGWK